MGWSRPKKLSDFQGTVTDWAQMDLSPMLAHAREPAPHLPLLMLGHSLGGQILGITPDNAAVRASLHVTAGSGWYKLRSEEHTSELQSHSDLVCRLLLEKKKQTGLALSH